MVIDRSSSARAKVRAGRRSRRGLGRSGAGACVDHIPLEEDYPHRDSPWPRTRSVVRYSIGQMPAADARKLTWENAGRLFRHPVPASVVADPSSF
jgi:hypothetical protein